MMSDSHLTFIKRHWSRFTRVEQFGFTHDAALVLKKEGKLDEAKIVPNKSAELGESRLAHLEAYWPLLHEEMHGALYLRATELFAKHAEADRKRAPRTDPA